MPWRSRKRCWAEASAWDRSKGRSRAEAGAARPSLVSLAEPRRPEPPASGRPSRREQPSELADGAEVVAAVAGLAAGPVGAAADGCDGMNGAAGAPNAGSALPVDDLTAGEAFSAGAAVVCASAADIPKGKHSKPPRNQTLKVIERTRSLAPAIAACVSPVRLTMTGLPKLYDGGFIATMAKETVVGQRQPAITMCSLLGPCAPSSSVCSISAERDGPVMKLSVRGAPPLPYAARNRAKTVS